MLTPSTSGRNLRNALRADGFTGKILMYVKMNSLHYLSNPASATFTNTVTFGQAGVVQDLIANHEDWFLHRQDNGQIVVEDDSSNQYYYLDVSQTAVREWFTARIETFLASDANASYWDGIWLDNGHATHFSAASASAITTEEMGAGNSDTWRAIQKDWVAYLDDNIVVPRDWHTAINLQGEDLNHYYGFLDFLLTLDSTQNGQMPYVFIEFMGSGSSSHEETYANIEKDLLKTRYGQALAINMECVAHVNSALVDTADADELTEQQFAVATMLMVTGNRTTFSFDTNYSLYKDYALYHDVDDLGAPDGTFYVSTAGTFRRDFSNGYVTLTPPASSGLVGASVIHYNSDPLVGSAPPFVTAIPDRIGRVGDAVSLQVLAEADGGGALTYSAIGLPDGLSINEDSGVIEGVIQPGSDLLNSVTITVDDGTLTSDISFVWAVKVGALIRRTNIGGAALTASENDIDTTVWQADADSAVTANGSSVSANGATAVTSYSADVPPWKVAQLFRDIRFDSASPGPAYSTTVQAGVPHRLIIYWQNQADADNARQTAPVIDGVTQATVDPYDLASGVASRGTVTTYTLTPSGSSTTLALNRVAGTSRVYGFEYYEVYANPTIDSIDAVTLTEGQSEEVPLSGNDPNGGSLVYSVIGLPDWVTVDGSTLSIAPEMGDAGEFDGVIRATKDGNALYADTPLSITVQEADEPNEAPVLAAVGNRTGTAGELFTINLSATDANGDALTYSAMGTLFEAGAQIFTNEDNLTGLVTWADPVAGEYTAAISVADGALFDTENITVTIDAVEEPPDDDARKKKLIAMRNNAFAALAVRGRRR